MKIGVVGLGLIGGSIFKGLCNKYEVVGIQPSPLPSSPDRGIITDDYSMLRECNVVFVCTPMNKTLETLDKLEEYLDENTIVSDVCSLKEFVSQKTYKYKFIPSHPMAGTEHRGWENSFPELFSGAVWAITPKEDTDINDFEILKSVIHELGAKTLMTTPREHDKAVALISHTPMLVAQALCKNIENNELAQNLASSGFRDTTRLALSNTEMANDMIVMNNENIKDVVSLLKQNIDVILESDYQKTAGNIKQFRQSLYDNKLSK